jgi:alkylation response protein AidB-like acyl-CoA dehydrogenase
MRQPMRSEDDQCWGGRNWVFASEGQQLWMERMAAKGWTAPRWPAEYGGGGLSGDEAKVLGEELARIGARRPLSSFGLDMLGPRAAPSRHRRAKAAVHSRHHQRKDTVVPRLQ